MTPTPPVRRAARRALGLAALCAGLIGTWTPAQAGPYSSVFVFGDSLSDTGNVAALTTAFLPPTFPSYPGAVGRFSNGPVWTEALAAGLGRAGDAAPANLFFTGGPVIPIGPLGGQNYAYGGARTGLGGSAGPTTGLLSQLINWNGHPLGSPTDRAADSNALYVVYAGANDLRDARTANFGGTAADVAARTAAAQTVADNVTGVIAALAGAGARHFLVGNLPDLGRAPEVAGLEVTRPGVGAASTHITHLFNADLALDLLGFDATFLGTTGIDLDIRTMDVYGLTESIVDDALHNGGARYGITNITAPCIERGGFSGQYFAPDATDADGNCGQSLFSDDLHPSAVAHRLFGALAVGVAIPAPASLPLVLLALGAGVVVSRRRRAA